jgi:hypothetical protein
MKAACRGEHRAAAAQPLQPWIDMRDWHVGELGGFCSAYPVATLRYECIGQLS